MMLIDSCENNNVDVVGSMVEMIRVDSRLLPLGVFISPERSLDGSSLPQATPIKEWSGTDTPPFHMKEVTLEGGKKNSTAV